MVHLRFASSDDEDESSFHTAEQEAESSSATPAAPKKPDEGNTENLGKSAADLQTRYSVEDSDEETASNPPPPLETLPPRVLVFGSPTVAAGTDAHIVPDDVTLCLGWKASENPAIPSDGESVDQEQARVEITELSTDSERRGSDDEEVSSDAPEEIPVVSQTQARNMRAQARRLRFTVGEKGKAIDCGTSPDTSAAMSRKRTRGATRSAAESSRAKKKGAGSSQRVHESGDSPRVRTFVGRQPPSVRSKRFASRKAQARFEDYMTREFIG